MIWYNTIDVIIPNTKTVTAKVITTSTMRYSLHDMSAARDSK